jgi:hypothetical protein
MLGLAGLAAINFSMTLWAFGIMGYGDLGQLIKLSR